MNKERMIAESMAMPAIPTKEREREREEGDTSSYHCKFPMKSLD